MPSTSIARIGKVAPQGAQLTWLLLSIATYPVSNSLNRQTWIPLPRVAFKVRVNSEGALQTLVILTLVVLTVLANWAVARWLPSVMWRFGQVHRITEWDAGYNELCSLLDETA